MYVDVKTNIKGNQTTVLSLILRCRLCELSEERKDQEVLALKVVESESSPERKHKRRKKKCHLSHRRKKSRSKKSREKHSSSESEDGHNLWKPRCSQTKIIII